MSLPFDVKDAFISDNKPLKVSSSGRIHKTKDILLPHQSALIHHIGIDIGGTLAKVTYFTRKHDEDNSTHGNGGKLKFFKIETEKINEFIHFLKKLIVSIEVENGILKIDESKNLTVEYYTKNFKNHSINLYGTGGGSIKFSAKLAQDLQLTRNVITNSTSSLAGLLSNNGTTGSGLPQQQPVLKAKDEMESLIVGLNFLLNNVPNEVFVYDDNLNLKIEDERKLKYINFTKNPQSLPTNDDINDMGNANDHNNTDNDDILNAAQLEKDDDDSVYPYLLVNIGSGVSMIKVTGPKSHIRIGGSSIGGGTLWGILSLLTNAKTYDDMLGMASNGDNANVDMLVGDIYGESYNKIGLKSTTIASSFGKVFKTVTGKMDGGYNKNDESVYGSESDAELLNGDAAATATINSGTNNEESSASSTYGSESVDSLSSQESQSSSTEDMRTAQASHTATTNGHKTSAATTKVAPQSYHQSTKENENENENENVYPSLSQFQRLSKFKQSDISKSLLYAVSNNIGQIAYLQAEKYKLKKIFFAGSFIRNHLQTIITLSYAINFWSSGLKKAYFLRHEGYLGSIGAFLSAYEDQKFYYDYLSPKEDEPNGVYEDNKDA